jgi:hypothetical protein
MNEAKSILFSGGREVESIFELFGFKEDDISQAIAWSLKQSPKLLTLLMNHLGFSGNLRGVVIHFQRHESIGDEAGRTDIEIESPGRFHIILEAKRGWPLPGLAQLTKYANRESFGQKSAPFRRLVSVSECSAEYAAAGRARLLCKVRPSPLSLLLSHFLPSPRNPLITRKVIILSTLNTLLTFPTAPTHKKTAALSLSLRTAAPLSRH